MTEKVDTPIHALTLACPGCGETTQHRVLHAASYRKGASLRGVARCNSCRFTHPFEIRRKETQVRVVLSSGEKSTRTRMPVEPHTLLRKGAEIEVEGKKATIMRLETGKDHSAESAEVEAVKTVWAVLSGPMKLKLSLIRGSVSVPFTMEVPQDRRFTVGGRLDAGGETLYISAIRVKGKTLMTEGQGAPARDIQRVYTRVEWTPPPGSSD